VTLVEQASTNRPNVSTPEGWRIMKKEKLPVFEKEEITWLPA